MSDPRPLAVNPRPLRASSAKAAGGARGKVEVGGASRRAVWDSKPPDELAGTEGKDDRVP
jgi:hypothetical protein